MDEELDFFVRDCFAEPGSAAATTATTTTTNTNENLQLIADG